MLDVTFSRQLSITFPVSSVTVALALVLAFMPAPRSYISSHLRFWLVCIYVKLGLYKWRISRYSAYHESDTRSCRRRGAGRSSRKGCAV
ncbi:hypothetical protein GGR58DRAFT_455793 [Xylaria digitata]|nr:hypothetical protein GGR58DRAFT_455793 [Xylaria digitata]